MVFSIKTLSVVHFPSLMVTKNKNNTYTVVGGIINKDRNIYIINDGRRVGVLGEMLTKYSFFSSENKVVYGAVINPSDHSGQKFFDSEIASSHIDVITYMRNAYGNRPLDFKKRGIANRGKQSVDQYMYRGMPFKDQDGRIYYATARDIGNYSAGYVAGTAGQGWVASRKAFDALESLQQRIPSKEAMVSQFAEKAGHNRGIKVYWQEQHDVQRILQQGREHTWKRISDFFKSVFK